MTKSIKIKNLTETNEFAKKISKKIKPGDVICLFGDLGVGKTVIAKSICKYFGISDDVISPTFNILKSYKVKNGKIKNIYHFDLYRIKDEEELINIGFEDYILDDSSITIIEWPEVASKLLLKKIIKIEILYDGDIEQNRIINYEV